MVSTLSRLAPLPVEQPPSEEIEAWSCAASGVTGGAWPWRALKHKAMIAGATLTGAKRLLAAVRLPIETGQVDLRTHRSSSRQHLPAT
jgi:hypothetical protein